MQKLKQEDLPRKNIIDTLNKQFQLPISTLYDWYRDSCLPHGRKGKITHKPELFYLIGAILGDGCLYKWKTTTNYIILVGDKNFTHKFATMIPLCTNTPAKPYIDRHKNIYTVRINNFELFNLCNKARNNTKYLQQIILNNGPKSSILFVEGFFDAEGCVKIIKEKVRRLPKICLDITNTYLPYLDLVRNILHQELKIKARYSIQKPSAPNRKTAYHLRIYKKKEVKTFLENISTIKLKKEKVNFVKNWLQLDDNSSLLVPS